MILATTPGLTRLTYHFYDSSGKRLGSLRWPDVAVATNARLKEFYPRILNRQILMELGDETYCIVYEYLNRGWDNDVRFRLLADTTTIASADIIRNKAWFGRHPTLQITEPFAAKLVNKGKWYSLRFELQQADSTLGVIYERNSFTLKRRITVDLPDDIELPVQFFLFFLVVHVAYK